MDIISAACFLRNKLVALHNSDMTVSQLENAIANVDQQSMMSVIEDKQSHHLRLLLRLSVNEGVCHMYKQYSSRKWTEVQKTASAIKSSLEADDNVQMNINTSSSATSGQTFQDRAAGVWTSVVCELSRCD
ncbi:uncharacterized protein LOC132759012 [Ruditapes philippinarum]|uniref:uncharacterized protein LOC132759012 n=1 Tax=Ruditapes philippinarum TaxID=129788 RepID=UPI00295B0E53|nr:uncharacterized protein LOC132759012 [Ruditapes philippinarum]